MRPNTKRIFLSYSKVDEDIATRLYKELVLTGFDVWFDKNVHSLPSGVNWHSHIESVISDCDVFIAVISEESSKKRGYANKELRLALDIIDEFPEDHIFLISVRVNECKPSIHKLTKYSWIDLFPDWKKSIEKITTTIEPTNTKRKNKNKILPTEKEYKLFIGQFSKSYLKKFKRIEDGKLTFSWPILIYGLPFLLCRKMYIFGITIFSIYVILFSATLTIFVDISEKFTINDFEYGSYGLLTIVIVTKIIFSLFFDRIYKIYAINKIISIRNKSRTEMYDRKLFRKGGVNYFFLLFFLFIFILDLSGELTNFIKNIKEYILGNMNFIDILKKHVIDYLS